MRYSSLAVRFAQRSVLPSDVRSQCHCGHAVQPQTLVVLKPFCFFISLVTATDITVWIISALLAIGIGLSKYAKWRTRDKLVRDLAAMDREHREKVLSRMNPELAMEARQELMRRFHI